ncbi:MAG: DMT family transporter [Proteobacteria bacterium]|nr:DMT family transporter [Pseudomonadota bacterium]
MAYFLLVLSALFWSGNFVVARGIHEVIPPVTLAFFRWALALVIFLPFTFRKVVRNRSLIIKNWGWIAVLSLLSVSSFSIFIYMALNKTTVVNTALVNSFYPVLIVIGSWVGFSDRITLRQGTGVVLSLTGLMWILSKGKLSVLLGLSFSEGDLWTLAAGCSWALYSVLLRKKPQELDHFTFLAAMMIFGTFCLLPVFLWEIAITGLPRYVPQAFGGVLYIAVFPSILSFLCWNKGVERVGANRAGIFVHLIPVFSILMAIILLGERLQYFHLPGMALIFSGIFLTTFAVKNS